MDLFLSLFHHQTIDGTSRLDISAIVFHLMPCAMLLLLLIMISITCGFQVARLAVQMMDP